MGMTLDEARGLRVGDKIRISNHEHLFEVTGVKPHPEGVVIEHRRADGYKSFSTHHDLDFIDPVRPAFPRLPNTQAGANPYLAGGVQNLSAPITPEPMSTALTKDEILAKIAELQASLDDQASQEQGEDQSGDKSEDEAEGGESEDGEESEDDSDESPNGVANESATQTGRGRRRR